jgi:hypothetical protein
MGLVLKATLQFLKPRLLVDRFDPSVDGYLTASIRELTSFVSRDQKHKARAKMVLCMRMPGCLYPEL